MVGLIEGNLTRMSGVEHCPACGKEVKVGKAGSLTQWLFSDGACDCGAKLRPSAPEEDTFIPADSPGFCGICGKLKSSSREGSLTQWVFSAERCNCDIGKLDDKGFLSGNRPGIAGDTGYSSGSFQSDIDDELKAKLESDEIDYHGLAPDSFPFDRYRIIEETGRGNAGIVFVAWDRMLGKKVAIKTLYSELWAAEELMRLQKEARASSRLSHRNVLRVLDFGAAGNGQPYMVMEFVSGETLREMLDRDGPIPLPIAMEIFFKICTGVRHAHKQGVFHRDLKPDNIMVGGKEPGRMLVKVIDFGIAAVVQHSAHADVPKPVMGEQLDTIVGSPLYMSPDQIKGGKFDDRSDIYSIGCIMFECLTGNVPFIGKSALSTMSLHANEEIPSLSDVNENVDCPEQLELIIRKCLRKEPKDRFQTVDELYATLRECTMSGAIADVGDLISETEPAEVNPSSVEEPVKEAPPTVEKPKTANRTLITAAICLITLCVVLAFSYYLFQDPETPTSFKPSPERVGTIFPPPKRPDADVDQNNPFHGLANTNPGVVSKYDGLSLLVLDAKGDATSPSDYKSVDAYLNRAAEKGLELEEFEINNAIISPDAFAKLAQIKTLKKLTLARTSGLSDQDLERVLPQLHNLTVLRIRGMDLPDSVFKAIGTLSHLRTVELDKQTKVTPEGLASLQNLKIDDASFKESKFTHGHFDVISKFRHLEVLFIGDSGVTDSDLEKITNLKKLHVLGINGSDITDAGLAHFAKCPNMSTLYAFRCKKITPAGVDRFVRKKGVYLMNEETMPDMANWGIEGK